MGRMAGFRQFCHFENAIMIHCEYSGSFTTSKLVPRYYCKSGQVELILIMEDV